MKRLQRKSAILLGSLLPLLSVSQAWAQTATVKLSVQKQYIRGFGGMNHPVWAGDLTAANRTTAFGNADGQLGFSALRIWVSDNQNDWSKEVATAKAAQAAGATVFATPWNPPSSMKSGGAIVPSQFAAYATHLNSFVSYMKGQGVNIYAIAVQNEPDYASEWTKWTQAQCHDFILNHGASISTKLISCESFNYNKSFYDPILNDPAALANMDILGTHLYGTAVSAFPYALFDQKGAGKERWMTEHYTDSKNDADLWPMALDVATELHNSMVQAQFSLYTWWYIRRSYGPIKENGVVSKRGWCMAQFSKFIRPGYYRVDATASPTTGVYVSAYKGPSDVVVVVVNTNTSTKSLTVTIDGASIASYDRFTTSASKNFANDGKVTASNGSLSLSLDASSVTTLHGTGTVPNTGGTTGVGGASGTGGASATAGNTAAGGTPAVGGNTANSTSVAGGAMSTGGATAVGGSETSGDPTGSGGVPGSSESTTVRGSSTSNTTGVAGAVTGGGAAGLGSSHSIGGGSLVTAGAPAEASSVGAPTEDSGCSCQVVGNTNTGWSALGTAFVGLLTLMTRRRRARWQAGA